MEQAAIPGGPGLPCSPKQALALYLHLFRCPAGLGQLQAALQQVQESRACPLGLELPAVLLAMERTRRAQEQLLWDLELLAGAGLSLFWPPRAQFHGLKDQAQCAWSHYGKPRGRRGRGSEQLTSWSSRPCPLPPAGDSLSQDHQPPEGGLAVDPSSALDLGEAARDRDPRWASPALPAAPTPGCLRGPNPATSSSFGDPGGSEFKNLAQREERRPAGPTTQRPNGQPSTNVCGGKLTQGAPRPSGLPSQGLPETQVPLEGLGWSLRQERAELQKLLGIEIPLRQKEGDPREQKGESPRGQRGEAPLGENKEVPERQREKAHQGESGEAAGALREEVSEYPGCAPPQSVRRESPHGQRGNGPKCQRKKALQESREWTPPQGQEVKTLRASPGPNWEVAEEEVPTQPPEEGGSLGTSRDFCRALGEQIPQPRGRESGGSGKRTSQRREPAPGTGGQSAAGERVRTPLPPPTPPTRPPLPSPGTETLAAPSAGGGSGRQERPAAPPEHSGPVRDPHGLQDPEASPGPAEQMPGAVGEPRGDVEAPEASKAAWPRPRGREEASAGVSAAQQETALQRLLELHRAARRRRRQDREQQRLRVLECLRIARNRHCRVHPLGPSPNLAQLPPQVEGGEGVSVRVLPPAGSIKPAGSKAGGAHRSTPPQEDAAGQRRALRQQLQQVHRERTGRLRALGARNTQNFQQLLWPPRTEVPFPGEEPSSFPAPSSHC